MGTYTSKLRNNKIVEILIKDKYDDIIKKEFISVFPIIDENKPDLLPYNSFIRFLKAKGIKYI